MFGSDNWNPLDKFWRIVHPMFHPASDASPVRMSPVAPIWDLPSIYGNVEHPENKDGIPHFVNTGYFEKLAMEPQYPIVHHDPPIWMIMSNFGAADWFVRIPLITATGPAFALGYSRLNNLKKPSFYTLFSVTLVGFLTGIAVSHTESETRLQGFIENSSDVAYWKKRAAIEKKILSGEVDAVSEMSFIQQKVHALFGPQKYDLKSLEDAYYGNKE